jgi:hypothetical protein
MQIWVLQPLDRATDHAKIEAYRWNKRKGKWIYVKSTIQKASRGRRFQYIFEQEQINDL